jgi:hypothetical protein
MESGEAGRYPSISLRIISHSYRAPAQRHRLLGAERCARWARIFVINGIEERLGATGRQLTSVQIANPTTRCFVDGNMGGLHPPPGRPDRGHRSPRFAPSRRHHEVIGSQKDRSPGSETRSATFSSLLEIVSRSSNEKGSSFSIISSTDAALEDYFSTPCGEGCDCVIPDCPDVLASNLNRLGVDDSVIHRILRLSTGQPLRTATSRPHRPIRLQP